MVSIFLTKYNSYCNQKYPKYVSEIHKYANIINHKNGLGWTALMLACRHYTLSSVETIKELIVDLNKRLNHRVINEVTKIYKFYNRDPKNLHKISTCDIVKYNRLYKNRNLFDPKHVINVIFLVLDKFFNIKAENVNEKAWGCNVRIYKLSNKYLL